MAKCKTLSRARTVAPPRAETRPGSAPLAHRDSEALQALADHVIERHFPEVRERENPVLGLLEKVIAGQAALIAHWQLLGFIHGVMNTDNMLLCGETIDYGPCAFMDQFNPEQVYSSIDHGGRYAYANQPRIAHWNLAAFAQTLLPLLGEDEETAVAAAQAVTGVETVAGAGVEAVVDGRVLRIGRHDWVAALSGDGRAAASVAVGTRVYLGGKEGLLAEFVIADEVRPDAAAAVGALTDAGYGVVIASGDNEATVRDIARRLGVGDWHAGLTPAGKVELVRRLQGEGRRVVMIGDGINDAPVLEAADASLAMDAGTALARASADAIVLGRRLMSVHDLARIAAATRRIVRQNVAWAIGYNLAAVPLAAAGWLSPWMAALGMSASSLVVVSNALRLNRSGTPRNERAAAGRPAASQAATP